MRATYVSPVRTPVTGQSLREALRARLGGNPSEHALTTLVAMSALETGHWKSCWNYNLGNVKASDSWEGEYTCLTNVREIIGGRERWFSPDGETKGKNGPPIGERFPVPPGHPATRFRAFGSMSDGCSGWVEKLTKGYRGPLEALLAGASTDDFAAGLKRLGYFTADLDAYQSLLRALYAQYGGDPLGSLPLVR